MKQIEGIELVDLVSEAANTANYHSTQAGTRAAYFSASASVGEMRTSGNTMSTHLGGDINEDGSLTKKTATVASTQPAPSPAAWTPPA